MPVNRFKRQLAAKQAQIGLWLGFASPYTTEAVASAGFDWLLIDGEHAPNSIATTLSQLQALAPYPVQAIARPVQGEVALIKQYLDLGVQTLLIPLVESAEQAEQLVRAMRYPPLGVRGVGSATARASRWNAVKDYVHHADQEMCLLVQVETLRGLEHLAEIASVDGVDGVFFGPADLSASMGLIGQLEHERVREAIFNGITEVRRANKAPGVLAAQPLVARQYLDAGCLFVAVGLDTMLLTHAARARAAQFGRQPC